MENLNIKADKQEDINLIKNMIIDLGYERAVIVRDGYGLKSIRAFGVMKSSWLYSWDENICLNSSDFKELTIPQLKDMVVLKRNDVGDATHINFRTNTPFLVQGSREYFYLNNKWILSDSVNDLKPIEKKEMKEFLVNHEDKWTLQLLDSDTEENNYRVAVPSGAECLTKCDNHKAFWMNGAVKFIGADKDWDFNYGLKVNDYLDVWGDNAKIIWKRSEDFTKVTIDELKHRVYKKDVSHLDSIDVYRVLELFDVKSHAIGHAIKKLLCSGGRGSKDEAQDIQEAIDSLVRYQEMKNEDKKPLQDWINSSD